MTDSITHWYAAGAKLKEIRIPCEAIIRGDQPEIELFLTDEQLTELYRTAAAIVTFCVTALEKNPRRLIPIRDERTYAYAKQYARSTANYLLHRSSISEKDRSVMQAWLDLEPSRPRIEVVY